MGGYGRTPYATEIHDTSQKSPRNPDVTPWLIVIHHTGGSGFRSTVTMELGTKQVSSTVIIEDDECASMFDERYRAWSLSSGYYDSVSLSSETCNSGGAAQGWPISEASYRTLAKVVAEWCRKYGIPANRERIIGHREVYTRYGASYATACPGGIDLDRLVAMVVAILQGGGGNIPLDDIEDDMKFYTIKNEKGGLNGSTFAVYPNGFTVFDSLYWANLMAGAYGETVETIDQGIFEDRCNRLNIPFAKVQEYAVSGGKLVAWSWAEEAATRSVPATISEADRKSLASEISAGIKAGATSADVERIINASFNQVFKI